MPILNPATILPRLDPDQIAAFIRHARTEHGDGATFAITDCPDCSATVTDWILAGLVTAADLTPYPPAPAPPAAAEPVGDIRDAVDTDGNLLCACGCRRRITDRSPSAYFASQYCFTTWHEERIRPEDEIPDDDASLDDLDADDDFDEAGGWTTMLTSITTAPAREPAPGGPVGVHPTPARHQPMPLCAGFLNTIHRRYTAQAIIDIDDDHTTIVIPAAGGFTDPDLHPYLYRRRCTNCGELREPRTVHTQLHAVIQQCNHCHRPLGGRNLYGWVTRAGDDVVLSLEDGTATASYRMTPGIVDPATINEFVAIAVWYRLETELAAFTASYLATPTTPAPGDDIPYLLDLIECATRRPVPPWRARG
jgi:hypothetical protein